MKGHLLARGQEMARTRIICHLRLMSRIVHVFLRTFTLTTSYDMFLLRFLPSVTKIIGGRWNYIRRDGHYQQVDRVQTLFGCEVDSNHSLTYYRSLCALSAVQISRGRECVCLVLTETAGGTPNGSTNAYFVSDIERETLLRRRTRRTRRQTTATASN